jgi:hypothetical protein
VFILGFIFWLLLPLVYSYLLFLLFKNEKFCFIIMMLNGIFVIVQYYILLILHIGGDIVYASLEASKVVGVPVILLALLYQKLGMPNGMQKARSGQSEVKNIIGILAKTALCFMALAIAAYGYNLLCSLDLRCFGYLSLFIQDALCAFPLIIIAYGYLLFRLFGKHHHRFLIICMNAVFLMVLSSVRLFVVAALSFYLDISLSLPALLSEFFSPNAISIFANTAILLPVLALIFRSVEKHHASAALPANQNAPEESISPAHPDMQ